MKTRGRKRGRPGRELSERPVRPTRYRDLIFHDIQNLCASLILIMDRLSSRAAGLAPVQTDLLRRANRQALYMHRLVQDVRLLERPPEEKGPPGENVRMADLLRRALYLVRSMHFDRSFDAFVDCSGNLFVRDIPLAESVFVNLLDNAVRHTPAELRPEVDVQAARDGSDAVVTVRGGTPPDESIMRRLFESPCKGRSSKGSGMGLALVRRIVERAGGRIEARAAKDSFGGTFEVAIRLPAAPAPSAAPADPSPAPELLPVG